MSKTTVKDGNPYKDEGGRMPSTTGKPSGKDRGNNPPKDGKGDKPKSNGGAK